MAKRYKCPYCELRLIRKDLIKHIDKKHEELIPQGYTSAQLVYNQVNKIDHGKCRVCGKLTLWNEKSGRYNVLCDNPKCKEHMREEYKKNMLRVRGTYNILNDPEQQKKMLANRSISGSYKFSDGGILTYTGSYEKKCLEFMDVVMQIPSKDILSPGPTIEYEYNGNKHFYITDFYYIPYNLIIEVKDGGDNLNNKDSSSMRASREKTIEKERIITDRGEYNYIRLTNNDFSQLLDVFMTIKEKLLEGDVSKTYKINESVINDYFIEGNIISKIKNALKIDTNTKFNIHKASISDFNKFYNNNDFFIESLFDKESDLTDEKAQIIANNIASINISIKYKTVDIYLIKNSLLNNKYDLHKSNKFNDKSYSIVFPLNLFRSNEHHYVKELFHARYFNDVIDNREYREVKMGYHKMSPQVQWLADIDNNHKINESNNYIKNFTEDNMKYIDESTGYNHYSKDVHTIIDNLSEKEYQYINGGEWVDSNHIIYRKVEYLNNKPIGFIDVYSLPKFDKNIGLVVLAVAKEARGKGIGSKLVREAIFNHKENKDINKLRWLVDSDNKASVNMAKSLGFDLISDNKNKKEFIYNLNKSSINESDIEQIIFNKKQPFQKQITLYHGTDISNLDILIPNSYNVGRKNDVPKMSSFWFANKDYAESFASMTLIEKYNYNLLILLDNDMKVLIDKNYKDDIIKFLKSTKGYVYEKTIDISIVGYGHEGIFPEYTLDIPVKPDKRHIIMPNNLIKRIKFVPNDYLQDIKNKYKSGKMNFGSNFIQQILDKIIYYQSMVQRTKKIKDVRQLSVSDINNDIYYRVTYNNIGIYEAFKQNVPWNVWVDFKNSKACNWLPLPPKYENNYYSYFTYKGYKNFMKLTYPEMIRYLDKYKIRIEKFNIDKNSIVYSDKYQIVATNNNYIAESSDKSELIKGFKSKTSNVQYKTLSIDKPEIYDYLKNHFSKNNPMWEGVKDSKTYMDCFINGNNSRHIKRVGEVLINKATNEVIGFEVVEKPDNYLAIEIPNKKYRGYGFGSLLLEDAIKKHGCKKLYVAKDNKIAIKMYKNRGFEKTGEFYDGEYYLMELKESSINELCTINTSNTFIQTYIRLFVDYIYKKYKSNVNTIDIKIVYFKQAIEMKKKKLKYNNYSNDFIVINYNQITIVDEETYGNQPINYNSFLKFHITKVLLSTYACDDNTRLINAICTYESGIYNEIGEKTSELKDAAIYAEYLNKYGPNMVVNNLIKRSHTQYPIF